MKKTLIAAPGNCAMGLSSVRVDTGGGGCVQTKMRFFTIFGEIGADFEFWIYEESNIICFSAKNRVNFATSGLRVNFTPLRGELISAAGGENFACWRVFWGRGRK